MSEPSAEPEAEPVEPAASDAPEPADSAEDEVEDEGSPAVATPTGGPTPVPADPAEGLDEPTSMASVKLEIKDQDGKVFKDTPKIIRWDERFRIPLEIGNRVHEIDVEATRSGKTVELVLGYLLGGQELVRNFRLETGVSKRELIHIEGGIALAITVTPKTIKPKPQKARDKVETPTGSDPLAGAER